MNNNTCKFKRHFVVVALSGLLVACSSAPERNVSMDSQFIHPLGVEGLRVWDGVSTNITGYDPSSGFAKMAEAKPEGEAFNYLALSGGGVDGAFSAGVLNAWSESGERPKFDVVTGVSTGALVSVFAYLGEDYDDELKNYYTATPLEEMFRLNSIFSMFSQRALIDTQGFEGKVRDAITYEMMQKLAEERSKGRVLLVGTTNLDNEKMAIWDIGKIAQVGTDDARTLIQEVIIASSTIPGAFPAKLITIDDGVHSYDEMHVDGGVSRQVFLVPQWARHDIPNFGREQNIYVIRNSRLKPTYQPVPYEFADISSRSLSALIRNQGVGDVEFLYHFSQENEFNFKLAYIDSDFEPNREQSEEAYMQDLYKHGYQLKLEEQLWTEVPPSVE